MFATKTMSFLTSEPRTKTNMGDYIAASKRNNTAVVQTSTQNIVKTKLNPIGSQLSVYPINFFFLFIYLFFKELNLLDVIH